MESLKLFMVLLGAKPPGRHVEQHDVFFGIAASIEGLFADIRRFWPEAADKVHVDAWREVKTVDGYQLTVWARGAGAALSGVSTDAAPPGASSGPKLFFVNLGGYQPDKFEEQHYVVLTVKQNKDSAFSEAKSTLFYREDHFSTHIDDRYGVDVDDLYQVEDILLPEQKEHYALILTPATGLPEDEVHLGYLKLPPHV
jgi:hypothetical protein